MAYKLIWSPAARDDLHDIVVFIARDNPNRAMSFGYELISETDRLQEFPELGRIVPLRIVNPLEHTFRYPYSHNLLIATDIAAVRVSTPSLT